MGSKPNQHRCCAAGPYSSFNNIIITIKDPAANLVVLRGHERAVNAVAISSDNRWVLTGSDDNTAPARLWDLRTSIPT